MAMRLFRKFKGRRPGCFFLITLASLLAVWAGAETAGASPAPEVIRETLKNGLRVIIIRNDLAPVVTIQMNYLAGSKSLQKVFPAWPMPRSI